MYTLLVRYTASITTGAYTKYKYKKFAEVMMMQAKLHKAGMITAMIAYIALAYASKMYDAYDKNADMIQNMMQQYNKIQSTAYNRNKNDRMCVTSIKVGSNIISQIWIDITMGMKVQGDIGMTQERWKAEVDKIMSITKQIKYGIVIHMTVEHKILDIRRNSAGEEELCERYIDRTEIDYGGTALDCSIAELMQYMAECITQRKDRELLQEVTMTFDYATVYHCDMPAVVEMLKHKMQTKRMIIRYHVMYSIVHNVEKDRIYEVDTNVAAYVRKLSQHSDASYTMLKQREDKTSSWVYVYIKVDSAEEQAHKLTNIYI